jgi:hypothetical protein
MSIPFVCVVVGGGLFVGLLSRIEVTGWMHLGYRWLGVGCASGNQLRSVMVLSILRVVSACDNRDRKQIGHNVHLLQLCVFWPC